MEGKKILIVDDDEICRKSVSNFAKKITQKQMEKRQ